MTAPARAGLPRELRIIGGQWKRSKLPVADVPGLRPTPDRVRETVFNWLGNDLDGWRCLDAFAGAGGLGFEAASRGASEVTLIERESRLLRNLHDVHARLKAGPSVRIVAGDASAWMARQAPETFELVFLDPPFGADLFAPAVKAACRLVVPGGLVYLEADREFQAADFPGEHLTRYRHGRAGAVHFHLFQRAEPGYTAPESSAAPKEPA
ncbi:16S rRNA (guanine(966)-N(2))-methyltransferase RsmD [Rhizobacter sp. Root1221]|uniref:16S rRNA (guanine(966)-N(2))-methyltransferase RsmD n=1 Tax=Rhizobacter sp. Root1221 TaxID=1736433 RepID=UPI000701E98C|nr:16S rRNA (guanine(966)-N(2))-methyltransferase RsmD [Rhizobacter sp. Root1221]KQV99925.1 16S rRNA (guanine(966)-N(2))-methyltransferase RsmD [Rhizobacter sp. Root1221]